ncbi:TPA: helix-turn-helix transcriptional regulator [Streptococcus suis]|nr:helix-turn-helix transcriptional regulator [Streptococcus suis]
MNSDFNLYLKIFLSILKKDFKITANQIAEEIGISKNTLTNWKKGSIPDLEKIKNLLKFINKFNKEHVMASENNSVIVELTNVIESYIIRQETSIYQRKNEKERRDLKIRRKRRFAKNFSLLIDFLNSVALREDAVRNDENYTNVGESEEVFDNLLNKEFISRNEKNGSIAIQKNLAKKLHVSEAQISNWKSGKDFPNKDNLSKLQKLCSFNGSGAFLDYDFTIKMLENQFLESPNLRFKLTELEQKYFIIMKSFIKESNFEGILWEKISRNPSEILIGYPGEVLETVQEYFYRDCILLLKEAFRFVDVNLTFEEWLRVNVPNHDFFPNLDSTDGFRFYVDDIDYGYKIIREFKNINKDIGMINRFIVSNKKLFYLTKLLMNKLEETGIEFEDWLEEQYGIVNETDYFRKLSANLCNTLTESDFNNTDYVEEFYRQFWEFIINKSSIVDIRMHPTMQVYIQDINSEEWIYSRMASNYSLLKSVLDIGFEKGKLSANGRYLLDGRESFELLFKNHSIKTFREESQNRDFDKVKELEKLYRRTVKFLQ